MLDGENFFHKCDGQFTDIKEKRHAALTFLLYQTTFTASISTIFRRSLIIISNVIVYVFFWTISIKIELYML